MHNITITDFHPVKNHPYLLALANLSVGGIHLRGLRLERKSSGELALGFPGRKIQGHWQVVYETEDPRTQGRLLELLHARYRETGLAA